MGRLVETFRSKHGHGEIRETGNQRRSCWGFVGGDRYKGSNTRRDGTRVSARGDSIGSVRAQLRRR